jgi:CRP-like cAMP-binding protein
MWIGCVFGQYSLIYNESRKNTVKLVTDQVSMYTLSQDVYKEYQRDMVVQADTKRFKLLSTSKDLLTKFNDDQRRRLVSKMSLRKAEANEFLWEAGCSYNEVIVIESGEAFVYLKEDISGESLDQIDEDLGILSNKSYFRAPIQKLVTSHEPPTSSLSRMASFAIRRGSVPPLKRGVETIVVSPHELEDAPTHRRSTVFEMLSSPFKQAAIYAMPPATAQSQPKNSAKSIALSRESMRIVLKAPTKTAGSGTPRITLEDDTPEFVDFASDFRRASVLNSSVGVSKQEFISDSEGNEQGEVIYGHAICTVGKGCILGMHMLAGNTLKPATQLTVLHDDILGPCVSPNYSVMAINRNVIYSVFSVDDFERLFNREPLKQVNQMT